MTLAMTSATFLLVSFYRHLCGDDDAKQQQSMFFGRSSININTIACTTVKKIDRLKLRKAIHYSLNRSRVFFLLTALFVLCWYPLYCLTLLDLKFQQPTKLYKLLTFLACSNASLNPFVLILFDASMTTVRQLCCAAKFFKHIFPLANCRRNNEINNHSINCLNIYQRSEILKIARHEWVQLSMYSIYQSVGCRLGQCDSSQSH